MPKISDVYDIDDDPEWVDSSGPSKETLQSQALTWSAKARGLRIVDAQSCINASELLKTIKGFQAQIQKWFKPHVDAAKETKRKADEARAGLVAEQTRMEAPLVEAEGIVKRLLLAWETQQEQVRREQERALQIEAQRQADALNLDAAAALERDANLTGNADMLQEAQALLEQPTEAPAVSVARTVPKVAGVAYRDSWKAHPDVDVPALAAAVATGEVSSAFLDPNMTALNRFAQATKGTQAVAGVRFFNDRQIVARG